MNDHIVLFGSGSPYAEELNAILEDRMICLQNPHPPRRSHNERHPWDNIHLSKAERKGKTYEQMQELRAKKWERQGNKRLQSDNKPPINDR